MIEIRGPWLVPTPLGCIEASQVVYMPQKMIVRRLQMFPVNFGVETWLVAPHVVYPCEWIEIILLGIQKRIHDGLEEECASGGLLKNARDFQYSIITMAEA